MDYTKVPGSATAYRRQKQIEECLFENLLQRPYPSVSISDLCHQLGISRKSFYNYFPDKDSCFRAIISRKIHNCILRLTADLPENATDEEVIAGYLSYWKEEKGLFDIITRNNLLYLLMDQCISFLRDEDQSILPFLDTPQLQADSYVLSAFVSVQITLILQWYFLNFSTPLEEMVRTYQRTIYQPLILGFDLQEHLFQYNEILLGVPVQALVFEEAVLVHQAGDQLGIGDGFALADIGMDGEGHIGSVQKTDAMLRPFHIGHNTHTTDDAALDGSCQAVVKGFAVAQVVGTDQNLIHCTLTPYIIK